jgi:hypothetical protein
MRMKRVLGASLFLMQIAASAAMAGGCTEPPPYTEIPSGVSATREEMLSAQHALKVYDNAVKAYSDCLHDAGDTSNRADTAVEKLQKVAERFNTELRAFKGRNGAG